MDGTGLRLGFGFGNRRQRLEKAERGCSIGKQKGKKNKSLKNHRANQPTNHPNIHPTG
ncbi:uncharacterized protein RCO7_14332 [Rhynchosporium graminicola]|uniref:Uncharacterized protein n=1 Tax=Rhynchosporium graminicola TaxID=2792576 RepID=A0A1E1K9X2_9HELO|nr:uncharacterized protein RCO7_14332 [Rhynchosporium commune]